MLADVQLRKKSHQNTSHVIESEVFVGQSGNQPFSSLLLISTQPGTSPIVKQIYLIVLESLDTSSNLVMLSVTRSPRFLWSLFEAKNISRLSFFCGRRCPSSVSSLAIKASIPRRFLSALQSPSSGMLRAVGQQLLISHRQTDSPRCSLQATNRSRCNWPADFEVLACLVQADFLLVVSPATGIAVPLRKVHPLSLGLH